MDKKKLIDSGIPCISLMIFFIFIEFWFILTVPGVPGFLLYFFNIFEFFLSGWLIFLFLLSLTSQNDKLGIRGVRIFLLLSMIIFFRSLLAAGEMIEMENQTTENKAQYDDCLLVYHNDYNLTLYGIEKLHPFDSCKYEKIYKALLKEGIVRQNEIAPPFIPSEEVLLSIHTRSYLSSLDSPKKVATIVELAPIALFPSAVVRRRVVHPQRLATGGTIRAAEIALKKGFCVNLSGGYHHAHPESGSGFCIFADIPIAINHLLVDNCIKKALIIDCDVHHGDGNAFIFKEDRRVDILDIYQKDNFPLQKYSVTFKGDLTGQVVGEKYLSLLKSLLVTVNFDSYDIVFYNAGKDVIDTDVLGSFRLTMEDIVKRDEMVVGAAFQNKIPLVMLLFGGYSRDSWEVNRWLCPRPTIILFMSNDFTIIPENLYKIQRFSGIIVHYLSLRNLIHIYRTYYEGSL